MANKGNETLSAEELALKAAEQEKKKAETEAKAKTKSKSGKEISSELEARSKRLFKSFAKLETIYFTSDGTAFASECDAKNHAKTLEDKGIQTCKRK